MPYDASRDTVRTLTPSASSPARLLRRVTPSDTQDLAVYAKSLWAYVPTITSEATLRLTCTGGADGETVDVMMGSGLQPLPPVQVRRVWATGTTSGISVYALCDR